MLYNYFKNHIYPTLNTNISCQKLFRQWLKSRIFPDKSTYPADITIQ